MGAAAGWSVVELVVIIASMAGIHVRDTMVMEVSSYIAVSV
jgi:hypothetical protein